MRADENGIQHITGSDPVTPENNAHLLSCGECQQAFPVAHWLVNRRDD